MNGDPSPTTPPSEAAQGPRVTILRGGSPTDEQAAALAAALLSVEDAATSASPELGGWQRAALRESVGARRFSQRADLDEPR